MLNFDWVILRDICENYCCNISDSLSFSSPSSSFAVCLGPSLQLTDTQNCLANEGAHAGLPNSQYRTQEHTGPAQGSCDEATTGLGQWHLYTTNCYEVRALLMMFFHCAWGTLVLYASILIFLLTRAGPRSFDMVLGSTQDTPSRYWFGGGPCDINVCKSLKYTCTLIL